MARGRPKKNPVETLRSRVWAHAVCDVAQIPRRGYQMEQYFEPESIKVKADGTRVRSCKWDRILSGAHSPSSATRELVYQKLRRTHELERFYQHPLWGALSAGPQPQSHWAKLYAQMPTAIIELLYIDPDVPEDFRIRAPVTKRQAEAILRIGGMDALACMICLLRDGGLRSPTVLFQELEIMCSCLLIWVSIQSELSCQKAEVYRYFMQHIVNYDRSMFCKKDLWKDEERHERACFIWDTLLMQAEDLLIVTTQEEHYEFLYWYRKGDSNQISEELWQARDVEFYTPRNTPKSLKWLIKQLNKSRPKTNRIATRI